VIVHKLTRKKNKHSKEGCEQNAESLKDCEITIYDIFKKKQWFSRKERN
jgi:hypothetical protein